MNRKKLSKISLSVVLSIGLIFLLIIGILLRLSFFANNQYFVFPVECIENRYNAEKTKVEFIVFEYENDKQGFYIFQTKGGHFLEALFKIRDIKGRKVYHLKESAAISNINNIRMTWYEIGDFEYFIAKDEETIIKYADGKQPTYKESITYTLDGKEENSIVYLIDKS